MLYVSGVNSLSGGISVKRIITFILIILIFAYIVFIPRSKAPAVNAGNKLLRFHVVANSDLESDQDVKIKVRDEILKEMGSLLTEAKNREESIEIVKENIKRIEDIADSILLNEGKSYASKAQIGDFLFPVKNYGDITLPSGEYKALRVVLGEGGGKNWWCVMFPPLCFIDITKGLTSEVTEEELKGILTEEELKSITAFKQNSQVKELAASASSIYEKESSYVKNKNSMQPVVEFRFKSIEVIKSIFQKIYNYIKSKG